MDFEFWPAFIAGLVGGGVMSLLMLMMRAAGKTKMNMALIEGSMFTGNRRSALALGLFMHLVIMSALILGSLYALLFDVWDVRAENAWWVGLLFGIAHAILGGLAMVGVPAIHPRMSTNPAQRAGDGLALEPPGLFGKNYGSWTPPGFIMGHLVYGLLVGLIYAFLVAVV